VFFSETMTFMSVICSVRQYITQYIH